MDVDQKAAALSVLLRDAPLFAGLIQQGFLGLAQALHERRLPRGEVLFHQGSPGISLVIVGQGQLAVQGERSDSGPQPAPAAAYLGPGAVTGEMSCIDPAPRSATVVAAKDSLLYELTHPALQALYQRDPQVAQTIVGGAINLVIGRLRDTNRRLAATLGPVLAGSPQRSGAPSTGSAQRSGAPSTDREARSAGSKPTLHRGPLDLSALRTERGLSETDLRVLVRVAPPQRYPDGALLCREGEPAASCFIIGSGWVDVCRSAVDGQRVIAATGAGAMLGHLALVEAGRRPATVRSRGESVVLELRRDDFGQLLGALTPLGMRLQEQVAIAGIRELRGALRHLDSAQVALAGHAGLSASPEPNALRALQAVLQEWYPFIPSED